MLPTGRVAIGVSGILFGMLAVAIHPSWAQTYVWDADAGTAGAQDGGGTWSAGGGNWFNQTLALDNQLWVNGSQAILGAGSGAAGVISVSGAVTVGDLTFNAAGSGNYTLGGTGVMTLQNSLVTVNAAATLNTVLAGDTPWEKAGGEQLTLSGGAANTHTGLLTVSAGQLRLAKTGGATAVGGDLAITGGAHVTFAALTTNQLAATATVSQSGATSVFNGTGPNATPARVTQTLASLAISGGTFNAGGESNWNMGELRFDTGANRVFVGNSGAVLNLGGLSLTGMNGAATSTLVNNGFTVFGNSTARATTLAVGAGGLFLAGSNINLQRGGAGAFGSRLILDGDVATGGSTVSNIHRTGSEAVGQTLVELSSTAGSVTRTFDIAGGGANLTVSVSITNGAAATAGIVKTGVGTLTLSGTESNLYTGTTAVDQGTLILGKTTGAVAVAGDVIVNGGTLTLSQPNQFGATAGITIDGGSLSALSQAQTLDHFTFLSGSLATSGNTAQITVAGEVYLAGPSQFTINSLTSATPASWTVDKFTLTGETTMVVGGSNGVGNPRTALTVGAGGLVLESRTISLYRGNAGTVLNLNGPFTTTGNSNISIGSTGDVTPLVNLGAGTRNFNILNGTTTVGVEITGAGGITKTGNGLLQLTTDNTYTGTTTVAGGIFGVAGTAGALSGASTLAVTNGGLLQNGSSNIANNNGVSNRINPVASLVMADGVFQLVSAASGNAHTQTLDSLSISGGSNTVTALAEAGATVTLTFAGANPYQRTAGSVNFVQNPGAGGSIVLTQAPSGVGNVSGGLLVGATLNGTDLIAAQSGVLTAFSGWVPTGTDTWTPGASMDVTGSNPIAFSSTTINALRFDTAGAHTITLDGTHTISSGMLLVTPNGGTATSLITGGSLRGSDGGELVVAQHNPAGLLEIASGVVDHNSATSLVKSGPGVLLLSGANSFTGPVTVQEGTLRAADGTGLPSTVPLRLQGGVIEPMSALFDRALGSGAGEVSLATGAGGFSAFGTPLTVNLGGAGGTLVWGSTHFDPAALILNGASADQALTLANGLDLNGGVRTIRVEANIATLNGGVTNGASESAGLIKTGAGNLIIPSASSYTGGTILSEGILGVGHDAALGSGVIQLNGGNLRAETTARSLANTVQLTANSVLSGSQNLTLTGSFTNVGSNRTVTLSPTGGAVIELAGNVFLSDLQTASRQLTIGGSGARLISGVIANNAGSNTIASHLVFNGGGTLALTAENTYSGRTLVAGGGHLVLNQDRNLGQVPTSFVPESLILANTGRIRAAATFTLDANRGISIGNASGGNATADFDVVAGNTLTILGPIVDRTLNATGTPTTGSPNVGSFNKTSTGVLVLMGDSTFSGNANVNSGILRVGHANALGSTTGGTFVATSAHLELLDGVTITGETLTLSGGNGTTGPGSPESNRGGLQAAAGATAEWAGPINVGANNARIGVQEGGVLTVSGNLTDGGAGHTVVFSGDLSGTGTVILSGTGNDWGGNTNIVRGTVTLGAHNSLPTGTTLDIHFASANNSEYAGFDLNGFDQTVSRLINSGVSGANADLTNSSRTLSTFTVNQTVNATYNGIVTGNLALVKTGPAVMVLAQANRHTGGTTINEGVLRLTHGGALAEGDLTINGGATAGGTLDLNNVTTVVVNALSGGSGAVPGLIVNDSTTNALRTLSVGVNHASSTYAGNLIDNNGGSALGRVGLNKIGTGTLTLSGQNTHTGTTAVSNGRLIADFTSQHPLGTSPINLQGGELILRAATNATIGNLSLVQSGTDFTSNLLRIENGATITTPTLSGAGFAPLLVDLRGGATLVANALSTMNTTNGVLVQGGSNRATLYVQDDSGTGFATRNASNEIVRYTAATPLTATNTSGGTENFFLNSSLTRTATLTYHTLQLDAATGPLNLNMGTFNLAAGSAGRSILFTGNHDTTIAGTGAFTSGSVFFANYSAGTATLGLSLSGQATIISGPGLVVYTHAANTADLYVAGGTFRISGADRNYSGSILRIYGGGILEVGVDLNGAADGALTRPAGQAAGQMALIGSGGFSAHGADRVVAFGSVAAPENLTWGVSSFLSGPGGDNNYAFKLGSASSTHTLEFVNPINLGNRHRLIEVGNGTDSANVDARLTGVLSGEGGSLIKTGTGRLEITEQNVYTGFTEVRQGELQVTGSTGSGAVMVQSGAALLGTGVVKGADFTLAEGALLHAGAGTAESDIGTLTFQTAGPGLFDLQANSTIVLSLGTPTNFGSVDPSFGGNAIGSLGYYDYLSGFNGLGIGTGFHDHLSFQGGLDSQLLFASDVSILAAGFSAELGQIFNLIDWAQLTSAQFDAFNVGANLRDGSSDDFSQLDLPTLSGGLLWDVSAFTSTGMIVVVPEPTRALLLLLGWSTVWLRRRR